MVTPYAQQAIDNLRQIDNFQWYIIPIFVIVLYIYASEIQKALKTKNWNIVLSGLTLFAMDMINEIWNSLVFHFNNYAAFWMTPGQSAYIILIGWNIEIAMMFSIGGIVFAKLLLPDKNMKIFGISNRWYSAVGFTVFSVFIEVLLNKANALIWEFDFWTYSFKGIWLIFLFGYFHFYVVTFWVHDMEKLKNKLIVITTLYSIAILGFIVFIGVLHWI